MKKKNNGNNAQAKLGHKTACQLLSGACSKENDGAIRHFMTSEHATLRYVVVHGNRSHTRSVSFEYSFKLVRFHSITNGGKISQNQENGKYRHKYDTC